MRTAIPDLPVAQPMGMSLPAVYLDDDFTQRLTQALDEVLAPVLLTLDCLSYYFDPRVCPADILEWIAGWVALTLDDTWTLEQRRALVANAVELHRWRGTRRGLADHVRLVTGVDVEVSESGGCTWSADSGGPLPGRPEPYVEVAVKQGQPVGVDDRWLRAMIADAVPAHVQVRVRGSAVGRASVAGPR
ncbi:MAG TPA: phage tail protein [Pilimelia sp.]|nr:phage tail protein [Pilimelia sp.]